MVKKVETMSVNELINFFRGDNELEIRDILSDKEMILGLSDFKFNIMFLNLNDNYKKKLLNDKDIFEKIMNIPINKMKKSIMDFVSDEIVNYIYNSSYLENSLSGRKLVSFHLTKLSKTELVKVLDNENLKKVYQLDVIDYVNTKFEIDDYLKVLIYNSINSSNFNSLVLFGIKNEIELLIYIKFNILVNVSLEGEEIFINDIKIDYDFIRNINRKHILSLINLMLKKEENINRDILFVTVLKLYMIFGLDNSKKIINDFFTYATPASLNRVSYELFKENRREFRLKNQNKFYYHNMEDDFLKALDENNLSFFKNFCSNTSDEYIWSLINGIKEELLYLSMLEKYNKIKQIIDYEIIKREKYYQKLDTDKFYKYYKSMSRDKSISCLEIYDVISMVEIPYELSKEGKLIPDKDLNKFLLGNFKRDNDCILRMVFNKHAFGLNKELYNIINNFEKIKNKIIKDNNIQNNNIEEEKLSLNSISDIIDISKVLLYDLKPNEMDIMLETLSKILNSRKYCTEDSDVILDRILKLHVKRKEKVACAIEHIKGEFDGIKYKTVDFDSEDLLVSGIDTGSCFKVGGKGEEFFDFCLTNSRGIVFYLEYNNVRYVLPATINGNMLNINSIDPIIGDKFIFEKIMNVVKEIAKSIVNRENNKIELVTITNIHLEEFFSKYTYEEVSFLKYLPLNTDVYCDYNKKEVTNYVVYKMNDNVMPKYFDNSDLFYEKRNIPYILSPNREYDKERMNIKINSISYSSIDYLNISDFDKKRERYYYSLKDISDYIYIVGNKDWYIGIKKDRSIEKYILPYDERAIIECCKYLDLIENNLLTASGKDIKKNKIIT